MTVETPLFEIIIPNWNGIQFLAPCLDSLNRQSFRDFSVTVVDNGSSDDSVARLERDYPEVKIICLERNMGFSAAVNAGIRGSRSRWILLLNNDMEVDPQCLLVLQQQVRQESHYDFFALRMVNFHSREYLDGAGDGFLRGGAGYRIGTMERYGPPYDTDREVFGACAGAALYSREFFDRVGLFDEDFFAYLEDVDINIRARRLGLRCCYLSSAIVYHIGSATSGSKINTLTVRLSTRNSFYLLLKNYPPTLFLILFPVICIYQFIWFLFVIKKRKLLAYFHGVIQAVQTAPRMIAKRSTLPRCGLQPVADFSRVLCAAEAEAVTSIMARRSAAGKGNAALNLYKKIFL